MQSNHDLHPDLNAATLPEQFPKFETITSPTVTTAAAAYYLNRRNQTLRKWASMEIGPLRPVRVNGRLAWAVSDIKKLLSGGK